MDMPMTCLRCQTRKKQDHANAKYCLQCSRELRTNPKSALTDRQARKAKKLAGTMAREDIALEIGSSLASVKRWSTENKISLAFHNKHFLNPSIVKKVCEYYATHSKSETQKKFPNVRIRSIIERYFCRLDYSPKQLRWKPEELIKLVQFAGLVTHTDQAAYFARPGAGIGSIHSAWSKLIPARATSVNGLSRQVAEHFVTNDCPYYKTCYWVTEKGKRTIAFWIDIELCLKPEVPEHLKEAIRAMAKFQRWLHGRSYRKNLMRLLRGEL